MDVPVELALHRGNVLLYRHRPAEATEQDELVLHGDDARELPVLEGERLFLNHRRAAVLADRRHFAPVRPRGRFDRVLLGELRKVGVGGVVAGHVPDSLRLPLIAEHDGQHPHPLAVVGFKTLLQIGLRHLHAAFAELFEGHARPDGVAAIQLRGHAVLRGHVLDPSLHVRRAIRFDVPVGVRRPGDLRLNVLLSHGQFAAGQLLGEEPAVDFAVEHVAAEADQALIRQLLKGDLFAVDDRGRAGRDFLFPGRFGDHVDDLGNLMHLGKELRGRVAGLVVADAVLQLLLHGGKILGADVLLGNMVFAFQDDELLPCGDGDQAGDLPLLQAERRVLNGRVAGVQGDGGNHAAGRAHARVFAVQLRHLAELLGIGLDRGQDLLRRRLFPGGVQNDQPAADFGAVFGFEGGLHFLLRHLHVQSRCLAEGQHRPDDFAAILGLGEVPLLAEQRHPAVPRQAKLAGNAVNLLGHVLLGDGDSPGGAGIGQEVLVEQIVQHFGAIAA